MINRVHVIDPDVRRRARVSRELHSQLLHAEIYEDLDEFLDVAPKEGLIFLAHDPDRYGRQIGELMQTSDIRLPIVAYAESPSPKNIVQAMLAGASGYLEWPFERQELDHTLERFADEGERKLRRERALSEADDQIKTLSPREKQVLTGLVAGLANKAIAEVLEISPRTVEIHRSNMMTKLDAQSVADAVRIGLYAGLDECNERLPFQRARSSEVNREKGRSRDHDRAGPPLRR